MSKGSHLKIKRQGDDAMGVTLHGDRKRPEPTYFRIAFPGGEVTVARTSDDGYWVHVSTVDCPVRADLEGLTLGAFAAARLDTRGQHTAEVDLGDFGRDDLYHVALKVSPLGVVDPVPTDEQGVLL